jgi:hypothetical protein
MNTCNAAVYAELARYLLFYTLQDIYGY